MSLPDPPDLPDHGPDPVLVRREGGVLHLVLNRPDRHNALTPQMYDDLLAGFDTAEAATDVRVVVLRGAGGRAFAAGSEIGQFTRLRTGEDGTRYEAMIRRVLDRLATLHATTIAVLEGMCVGSGLLLASACDLRVATEDARFAVPVARTLGNCLSAHSLSLLAERLGTSRLLDLLITARFMTAQEADAAGYLTRVVPPGELDGTVDELVAAALKAAPLTTWSAKEILHRARTATLPDDTDVLATVYESDDFAAGVAAFLRRERAVWSGT
jgi:enoyl-CoA hydratase/carnithine racemase